MEFENLQIEVPTHDDPSQSQLFGIKIYEKKYHNNSKDFVVGFNPNSKEFIERKERRAKRFGVQKNADAVDEDENESDTASFAEINLDLIKWPPVTDEAKAEIRHDAILVYGVNEMSTKDVFEYFSLYGPDTLEWIDDCSCNVVWDDKKFVMQAMDSMSRTFTMLSRIKHSESGNPVGGNPFLGPPVTIKDEEDDDTENPDSNAIVNEDEEINPKDIWRVALPYKGNNTKKNVKEIKPVQLFFRPATISECNTHGHKA